MTKRLPLLLTISIAITGCFASSRQDPSGSSGDGDGDVGGDGDGGAAGGKAGGGAAGGVSVGGGGFGGGGFGGDGDGDGFVGGPGGFGGGFGGGGFAGGGGPFPGGPGGVPGDPIDLGQCQQDGASRGGGYCDTQLSCERGWAFVYCEQQGDTWWCACDTDFRSTQFTLSGDIGDAACDRVADLCPSVVAQDPNTPVECSPTYMEGDPRYCSAELECRRTIEVAPDVTAETVQYRGTYCDQGPDGWYCECYDGYLNARFELPGDYQSPQVCSTVLDACGNGAIEYVGQPSCSPRFQSSGRDYCDIEIECQLDARLDGMDVKAFQNRYANCQLQGGGQWSCGCQGGEAFELQGDDGWDVCGRAGERCSL